DRPPYAGLAAFRPEDADWFFGRERLVDDLVARLERQRLVVLLGPSGSGKSSVLRAGLLPRLQAAPTSRTAVVLTPGPNPWEECAAQLAAAVRTAPGPLRSELTDGRYGLHRAVRHITAAQGGDSGSGDGSGGTEIVLVIDQFEEVFTRCPSHARRAAFIAGLLAAVRAPDSRCRVVLGLRADFTAHCARHGELRDALPGAQVVIGPMSSDDVLGAITQPARLAGLSVEGALLGTLMAHARGEAGALPLLSYALLETWRRRRGHALTLAALQTAGGIEGALALTAERLYASLDDGQRAAARHVFLRLAAFGEGTEHRLRRGELDSPDDAPEDTAAILERAAAARLLTLDHDRVALAHTALLHCWPRLRTWLDENRDALRPHRRLAEAAREWEDLGEDDSALYRGIRLAMAQDMARTGGAPLTVREWAFLDACTAAETARGDRERRRTTRLRRLVALLAVLLLVSVTTTIDAARAKRVIEWQRDAALSREIAREAVALLFPRPALAGQPGPVAYCRLPPAGCRRGDDGRP
ncbi:XRE family transcriptional regulator, partial [Streptomyces sp. NPDC057654]